MTKAKAIFILGMHRSGTSALAGLLSSVGVDFSPYLLPAKKDNVTGFWEHKDIVEIHDTLLAALGRSWDDVRPLPEDWVESEPAKQAEKKLINVIHRDFAGSEQHIWGIKEPRACRLLPLWKKIFEQLHVEPHFLIIYRSPLEVAMSLKERDGVIEGKSIFLWIQHNLSAEYETRGFKRCFISYNHLLDHWQNDLEKIKETLDLPINVPEDQSFLDKSLRSHRVPESILSQNPKLKNWGEELFGYLQEMREEGGDFSTKIIQDELDELYRHVQTIEVFLEDLFADETKKLVAKSDLTIKAMTHQKARLTKIVGEQKRHADLLEGSLSMRATRPLRGLWGFLKEASLFLPRRKHKVTFEAIGNGQHVLDSQRKKAPKGWIIFSFHLETGKQYNAVKLLLDKGAGLVEEDAIYLPPRLNGRQRHLFRLPAYVKGIRLDLDAEEENLLRDIEIKPLSTAMVIVRFIWWRMEPFAHHPSLLLGVFPRFMRAFKRYGVRGVGRKLMQHALRVGQQETYQQWIRLFDTVTDKDRAEIQARLATSLPYKPLISVVMPTYNTPADLLTEAIESVQNQLYPHWELCIADDASVSLETKKVLKKFEKDDPRIKVTYRKRNGHISQASNSALKLTEGEFIALLDHDDRLAEHALYMVVEKLNKAKDADIIFSDEDKINEQGERFHPHFKPGWNKDLFYTQNYLSHLGVYRRTLVKKVEGFRKGYEGSQDYDLALRILEHTTTTKIHHIPHILYHWRATFGSAALSIDAKPYAVEAGRKALRSHFRRLKSDAKVKEGAISMHHRVIYPLPEKSPKISVIIPTKDRVDLLQKAVEGLLEKTDYQNIELLIVDNGSKEDATKTYLKEIQKNKNVRVLSYNKIFNFSAINNFAAREAKGKILCFMNNDVQPLHADWLENMLREALRPEIGVVGTKLYYPDGTLQHAGVLLTEEGVASHLFKHFPQENAGYFARTKMNQNFSAITGACMMMRKKVFEEVGGFDEKNLKVAFNDVDFCLRTREKGYLVTFTPYAGLYHMESATRGMENSHRKQRRFIKEKEYMLRTWKDLIAKDPYFNPNFELNAQFNYILSFPPRHEKPWKK
ncbi:MAG: glycosyltransferase [Alphaproteobacteria bacterium]